VDDVRERILERLREGESLSAICRDKDMPSRETVRLWQKDDEEFDLAVTRAREDGFEKRAADAVLAAKACDDAAKGRLAFDAERWYLGKLSNAFSDNKAQKHEHSGQVGVKVIEIQFGRGPQAPE
jgi:U3 small nucleolar RNA-associated protein 14